MPEQVPIVSDEVLTVSWRLANQANDAFDDLQSAGETDKVLALTRFNLLTDMVAPIMTMPNSPFGSDPERLQVPECVEERSLLKTLLKLYRNSNIKIGDCQLEPSCSQYGIEAIGRYGDFAGSLMAVARAARCDTGRSGFDPVPVLPRWRPAPSTEQSAPVGRVRRAGQAFTHTALQLGIAGAAMTIHGVAGAKDATKTLYHGLKSAIKR